MGILVSFVKSESGIAEAVRVPPALSIGAGNSPSGKRKPLPGSYEAMAFTF